MKKLSLFSLLGLAGLLAFIATPIYAQDVEDEVDAENVVTEMSAEDEFNYWFNEENVALEDAVYEDTIEGTIDLDNIENFNDIFENEDFQNALAEYNLTNEEALWMFGVFAGVGIWLVIAFGIIVFVLRILRIIALWKAFERAWEEWWKALIPVYCSYIKYKLAGMKNWFWCVLLVAIIMWILTSCIPDQKELITNIATLIAWIIYIVMKFKFARKYGWGVFGSVLFVLFYPICMLILWFGNYKYEGKEESTVVEA